MVSERQKHHSGILHFTRPGETSARKLRSEATKKHAARRIRAAASVIAMAQLGMTSHASLLVPQSQSSTVALSTEVFFPPQLSRCFCFCQYRKQYSPIDSLSTTTPPFSQAAVLFFLPVGFTAAMAAVTKGRTPHTSSSKLEDQGRHGP